MTDGTAPPRRPWLVMCSVPLLITVMDLVIRYPYLRLLDWSTFQHFPVSFLFEWLTVCVIVQLLAKTGRFQKYAIFAVAALISVVQVAAYGHFFYFGILPNPYAINYLIDHSADSLSLIRSSADWKHAVWFLALTGVLFVLLHRSVQAIRPVPVLHRRIILGLFIGAAVVFNNNVRFAPASYSFTPATVFSLKYALQERWFGRTFDLRGGYMRRRFTLEDTTRGTASYNCILFISESVRKRSMSAYGHRRPTTPFLDSLAGSGAALLFRRHVTNAVSTQYSVPMMLSGLFTVRKDDVPYIYDHVRNRTDARTYFFTSQSLQRSTIDLVYNTSLDTFVCQDRLSWEQFNDLGVDDDTLTNAVTRLFGDAIRPPFLTVIQFNNTHYPYTVKGPSRHFTFTGDSSGVECYENTIREQDAMLRRYFAALRSSGLLDSTVVFFLSDHGEAFGERGHHGHLNTLYGEEIDVPMWIYLPPGFPESARTQLLENTLQPTSHLDLFPTLMQLFGLRSVPADDRASYGHSLLAPLPALRIVPVVGKDMIDTKAAMIGNKKYIMTLKDGLIHYEAYDLGQDHDERTNLWSSLPDQERNEARERLNRLDRIVTNTPRRNN
ncbi:MAG: sulfatase-like hydrolase/transferase [Bacteroidetes bacterium]|nr:sulfatase-like hydrolase/transferase [Bacteroidota bacterium]